MVIGLSGVQFGHLKCIHMSARASLIWNLITRRLQLDPLRNRTIVRVWCIRGFYVTQVSLIIIQVKKIKSLTIW